MFEQISFVPAQAVFGGIFSAAVTTFQGTMILNFYFSKPSISQKRIETLVDDVFSCLINACSKEKILKNDSLSIQARDR
ncbi:hypothetical protein WA1_28865 [Scytonema hofmannii PCC 7110]|uniref:Uncharacterized protein n=1 Tax=Scytonema hofmannii PCC 7110 TaxID=128403 RepID=A0A139X5L6_9CYAN|nr:hypothetical protein [Scytonema hofmannii]KYC39974.1 hypothetical protein WA1_28865 [Scytonema hofmannii PCC 7110]